MARPTVVVRNSKPLQLVFLLAAAAISLLPLAAKERQGNSIRWSVDGTQVRCEYFRYPGFSHVRSYDVGKIVEVLKAPDSTDPTLDVIRFRFNGLNYNIPSQSSAQIRNFDDYLDDVRRFMTKAKNGDQTASYVWYHPWLIAGAVSAAVAVVLWIVVFAALAAGPVPRSDEGSPPGP